MSNAQHHRVNQVSNTSSFADSDMDLNTESFQSAQEPADHNKNTNIDEFDDDDDDLQYIKNINDIYKDKRFDFGARLWRAFRHQKLQGLQEIVDIVGPWAFLIVYSIFYYLKYFILFFNAAKIYLTYYCFTTGLNTVFPLGTLMVAKCMYDAFWYAAAAFPLSNPLSRWRALLCLDLPQLALLTHFIASPGLQAAVDYPMWVKAFVNVMVYSNWLIYVILTVGLVTRYFGVVADEFHPAFVTRTRDYSERNIGAV